MPKRISKKEKEVLRQKYLELIEQGYSEREIDKMDGMVSNDTRWKWRKNDAEFSKQYVKARVNGVTNRLDKSENRMHELREYAVQRRDLSTASKMISEDMRHARWLAKCLSPEMYGDKVKTETTINYNDYLDSLGDD